MGVVVVSIEIGRKEDMGRTYTRVVLLVAAFLMFPRAAPALTE